MHALVLESDALKCHYCNGKCEEVLKCKIWKLKAKKWQRPMRDAAAVTNH